MYLFRTMEDELRLLTAKLKAQTKELAKTRRRQRESSGNVISPTLLEQAMCIMAAPGGSLDLATRYIMHKRTARPPHETKVRDILTREWTNKEEAEKIRLRDGPHTEKDRRNSRVCSLWLKEQKLHEWVETQNMTKGIAPLQRLAITAMNDTTEFTEPSAVNCHALIPRGRRQWMRRWRRRWGVALSSVPAGDVLPPDVAQRKAFSETQPTKFAETY